jgi:hypothetical protein
MESCYVFVKVFLGKEVKGDYVFGLGFLVFGY